LANQGIHIAGAGICCLDYIVVAPQVAWGDTADIHDYCVQGGGLVATALVACARLGAPTELVSVLGDDAVGRDILDGLEAEGVSTAGVVRVPGAPSPFSVIHVAQESGERTIFHRRTAGFAWPEIRLDAIATASVVLVDGYYPDLARRAVAMARANGVPIIADASPEAEDFDWLRHVDVLIAPRQCLRDGGFGGDIDKALDVIHRIGPTTAIITLGADGWVSSCAEGRARGEAFRVDVVDTVGAGDVFHGAYAFALAHGWTTARCAEFASAVAAIKCTRVGGRTGIPDLAGTLAFLRERSPNDWSRVDAS